MGYLVSGGTGQAVRVRPGDKQVFKACPCLNIKGRVCEVGEQRCLGAATLPLIRKNKAPSSRVH